MKQITITNNWNIKNYNIQYTLEFTLQPSNSIITELPIINYDDLNMCKVSFKFQHLQAFIINVKDVSITSNNVHNLNLYCSFLDNEKISLNKALAISQTFFNKNISDNTFYIKFCIEIPTIPKNQERELRPTKRIKLKPKIPLQFNHSISSAFSKVS